jgi:hypothetical protein
MSGKSEEAPSVEDDMAPEDSKQQIRRFEVI